MKNTRTVIASIIVGLIVQGLLLSFLYGVHGVLTIFPYPLLTSSTGDIAYTTSELDELFAVFVLFYVPYLSSAAVAIVLMWHLPRVQLGAFVSLSILGTYVLQVFLKTNPSDFFTDPSILSYIAVTEFNRALVPQLPFLLTAGGLFILLFQRN